MIDFIQGDVLDWAAHYDGPKMHALLCDPPYELSFMGKAWDGTGIAFQAETWAALGEHLLPGAFGMAFASSRGYHRMAVAIEDAGFRIYPMLLWVTGSSFPKASRIDTAIDRAAGAEREVIGTKRNRSAVVSYEYGTSKDNGGMFAEPTGEPIIITAPATDLARVWAGHRYGGQMLKDAATPICVFQKPYAGRPVDSITRTGAGSLWIEGGRIGTDDNLNGGAYAEHGTPRNDGWGMQRAGAGEYEQPAGRWPSNLLLDPCAAAALGRMSGERRAYCANAATARAAESHAVSGSGDRTVFGYYADKSSRPLYSDTGTAARFFQQCDWALEEAEPMFYAAKASRRERDSGLPNGQRCTHPTVKALSLTKYLATLLLPPAEYAPRRLLVPFSGVCSEAIGGLLAGFDQITAIEAEQEYVEMARARAGYWLMQPALLEAVNA